MKKRLITAAAVATIGVAGLSTGAAFAMSGNSSTDSPMNGLVEAIAAKFNLKSSDVQAVFDEQRSQMEADREQLLQDKVAALVKDGTLTQAQADKINARRAELKKTHEAERASMQDKTPEERQSTMQTHKTELETWLKDNDIETKYAYLLMGGHHGHGMGERGQEEMNETNE